MKCRTPSRLFGTSTNREKNTSPSTSTVQIRLSTKSKGNRAIIEFTSHRQQDRTSPTFDEIRLILNLPYSYGNTSHALTSLNLETWLPQRNPEPVAQTPQNNTREMPKLDETPWLKGITRASVEIFPPTVPSPHRSPAPRRLPNFR